MTIMFQKATRHALKLKVGIDGPSGSGKTFGALALARGITKGGKIAVADSENESASFYADEFDFDTISVPDADAKTIRAVIDAAVVGGYDCLVIDSLSHAWLKILDDKDTYEQANPRSNGYANWQRFGKVWERLMKHILDAPIHIIATMRSKQQYEQTESEGKKKIVKLGLQPQVRDGAEYEFGLVFSVNQAHRAEATKDRTRMFSHDEMIDLNSPALHMKLVDWMETGGTASSPTPVASVPIEMASAAEVDHLNLLMTHTAIPQSVGATISVAIAEGPIQRAKALKWTKQMQEKIAAGGALAAVGT